MKMLIFVILSTLLASVAARNVTFHQVDEPIEDHYIIVMKPGYDVVPIKNLILGDRSGIFYGATVKHTYTKAINGFSAKLSKRALEKLLVREEIDYISQDGMVYASAVGSWGADRIGQRKLPLDGIYNPSGDGSGVNVYVIDTGIYPDSLYFGGRAHIFYDSVGTGVYGIDCNGHGTHCAGTIGAEIFGVAPGVSLFGVRVLHCEGYGYSSDVIAGYDYVANNFESPAVASVSLGGPANVASDDAVKGLIAAGVTTVVAAGNQNNDSCLRSPARVPEAITVGATAINDRRASFSNYGTCVDLFAPGVSIPSASNEFGEEIVRLLSGTSMACPHVSGAAAIALSIAPDMSPGEVKTKLMDDITEGAVLDAGEGSPNRLLYVE